MAPIAVESFLLKPFPRQAGTNSVTARLIFADFPDKCAD
jgi:hypothetical protein